jgi:predicted dinucleotide-binding enzyme
LAAPIISNIQWCSALLELDGRIIRDAESPIIASMSAVPRRKRGAGLLPAGAARVMACGTMSADPLESSSNWSPVPAVLFYAADDDRMGDEVERLVRKAGFGAVKVGGIEQSGRLEVGGGPHDLVGGPAQARSLIGEA